MITGAREPAQAGMQPPLQLIRINTRQPDRAG